MDGSLVIDKVKIGSFGRLIGERGGAIARESNLVTVWSESLKRFLEPVTEKIGMVDDIGSRKEDKILHRLGRKARVNEKLTSIKVKRQC